MSRDPVIRRFEDSRRVVRAHGGLHMIKGNGKPHFTLTMESYTKSGTGRLREDTFGAAHDDLVQRWPDLAPLAALHLSDIDGVPMHAAANGLYWLAGAVPGNLGQQYHGASGQFGKKPDECLAVAAKHFRISLNEARGLAVALESIYRDTPAQTGPSPDKPAKAAIDRALTAWVESQRPRWKAEADACRAALDLQIFGDTYVEA